MCKQYKMRGSLAQVERHTWYELICRILPLYLWLAPRFVPEVEIAETNARKCTNEDTECGSCEEQ